MTDTEKFFALLYRHAPLGAAVTLCTPVWRSPEKDGYEPRHCGTDPVEIAAACAELDALGRSGVYYGIALRPQGLRGRTGRTTELLGHGALWLDLDFGKPGHASDALPPDMDSAVGLIGEAGLPDPSISVHTGGGLQLLWLLDRLATVADAQTACRALQARVVTAGAAHGWHVDDTATAVRVFRAPGTTNRKEGAPPRSVQILEMVDKVFTLDQLAPTRGPATTSSAPQPVLSSGPVSPPHGGAGPLVGASAMPPEDLRRRLLEDLKTARSSNAREVADMVLSGRPLQKGRRDSDLTRIAGLFSVLVNDVDAKPEDIVEILHPMLEVTQAEDDDPQNPAPTRRDALNKLSRSMANARAKKLSDLAEAESLARGFIRAARASAKSPDDEEEPPAEPYTADEIRRFEAEHGSPLHWIVQRCGAHYILVGGTYQGPIATSDISVRFKESLAPAPLDLSKWDSNKGPRPLSQFEILDKYSTVADRIIADLNLTSGYYDRATKTFFESACSMRRIVPKFDPFIDRWLTLLGGKLHDKLKDWIACVTRLDRQCAALYLSKSPGTGKTILAAGLARIWSEGGPTSLKNIVGNWNDDLKRCPLVVADEYLPSAWLERGRGTASSELRELVGSSTRAMTRKNLPNTDLRGAIRIMLLANDKSMIPFDEQLGSSDVDAIAGRFLTIHTMPDAAEYLHSLGGQKGQMRDWVDGDAIAAHALWLKENRKVEPGARFIVEGIPDDTQRKLVYGTKMGGLVCEVIVRLLSSARSIPGATPAIRAGGGRLLVSTQGISEQWKDCISSDPVASTQKIGRQLATLSSNTVEKVKGQPYHVVREDYVFGWAEENHVGDVEAMRKKIDALPPVLGLVDGEKEGSK